MSRAIVSLQTVADYEPERVLAAMRACLEPLGGMRAWIQPGQRVLLKPNLLSGFAPAVAATTHPAVVRAAILLVKEAGGRALVGDSPGMGTTAYAAQGSGIMSVVEETCAQLVDFSVPHEFESSENVFARRLTLTQALSQADVFISLPKLKTHAQMTFTGALKNQFGLVPGGQKGQWHFRLQKREWLASLILDINRIAKPVVAIMDGIVGMEGQGPSGGQPRFIGALLASRDLAALDTLACHLIGLDPVRVPLLVAAEQQRYGTTRLSDIDVVGPDWRALQVQDFKKVDQLVDLTRLIPLPAFARAWIRRFWMAKPRIREVDCTRCGICEEGCPVKPAAIHPQANSVQKVDDAQCILCYCCHEFCPSHAIDLRQSWLARRLPLPVLADRVGSLLGLLSRGKDRKSSAAKVK